MYKTASTPAASFPQPFTKLFGAPAKYLSRWRYQHPEFGHLRSRRTCRWGWPDTGCCSRRCRLDTRWSLRKRRHKKVKIRLASSSSSHHEGAGREGDTDLAAGGRRTPWSRRWAGARCGAAWPSWWPGPVCRCCRPGTHSRRGTACSDTGRRRDSARDPHRPPVDWGESDPDLFWLTI